LTKETEESTKKKTTDELKKLRDENRQLTEKLHLQKTNWLYSHHHLSAICLGIGFGAILGSSSYIIWYAIDFIRFIPENVRAVFSVLGLMIVLGFPFFAYVPYIILAKAPSFSYKSWFFYLFSFFLFESLMLYVDPLNIFSPQYQGFERLERAITPLVTILFIAASFCTVFIDNLTERCGYKLVLDGSIFCFEVNAEDHTVLRRLEKLDEDFNLLSVRSFRKPQRVYFTGIRNKKKTIFQFFLKPKKNKTDVALVVHSIENDIPMRTQYDSVSRIGKTIMTWLRASGDFEVRETVNENLVQEAIRGSEESFHRQPVNLPSRKATKAFFKAHWKDIVVILSLLVALMSWLLPFK